MAKSDTTNVAYYFARRKDTGMPGVWYTHCADNCDKKGVIRRLFQRAKAEGYMVTISADDVHDTRFSVKFLEENFAEAVREYCQNWGISIAFDLHMRVLREAGHDIKQMP